VRKLHDLPIIMCYELNSVYVNLLRPNKKIGVVLVTRLTLIFTSDPKLFFPIFKNQLLISTIICLLWYFSKRYFGNREEFCTCYTLNILNNMFKNIILPTLHYLVCMTEVELVHTEKCMLNCHFTFHLPCLLSIVKKNKIKKKNNKIPYLPTLFFKRP
jgi:hypothetical protein